MVCIVDTGRWVDTKREDRLCQVCHPSRDVEDEQHFLFSCPAYSDVRQKHASLFQQAFTVCRHVVVLGSNPSFRCDKVLCPWEPGTWNTQGVARAGTWHTPDVCDCDQVGVASLVLRGGNITIKPGTWNTPGVARAGTWHTPDVCDCDQVGVANLVLTGGEFNYVTKRHVTG